LQEVQDRESITNAIIDSRMWVTEGTRGDDGERGVGIHGRVREGELCEEGGYFKEGKGVQCGGSV
jgi:hypothetical protein